jgi:hypothetical protein
MHTFNYAPTTLGVQSWREIIYGGTRTKKVKYHWFIPYRANYASSQKRVPQAEAVPSPTIEIYISCLVAVAERAYGSDKDTHVPDVSFSTPASEICARDGKFSEHSLSEGDGLVAGFLLDHESVVLRHASCYLQWMIPFLATADISCWTPLCLDEYGWETDTYFLQLLSLYSHYRIRKRKECLWEP